jgi:hypothetical protein
VKPLSLALCAALAACATTEPPDAEMAQARAAVAQAAPLAQDAPHEFAAARVKLEHAETALQRGHHGHAQLLAEEAEADARLALAVAENARMQRALRQETSR